MPELPEVESIRLGLDAWLPNRTITSVKVIDPRILGTTSARVVDATRASEFEAALVGSRLGAAQRRGKFMWVPLRDINAEVVAGLVPYGTRALALHLGMSGQVRIHASGEPMHPHTRVVWDLDAGAGGGEPVQMRFVDQRIFGHVGVEPVVSGCGGRPVVASAVGVAPDPFEPGFDPVAVARVMKRKRTAVKVALLDQSVISGIGNIYADEALFLAGVHPAAVVARVRISRVVAVVEAAREVMERALAAGGTSFDALYVHVNGESGYFERSLNVYGRAGKPCVKCGGVVRRMVLGGRGAHFCPVCQPVQRG